MNRGFGSDNHAGVHPEILEALLNANTEHAPAYGTDAWTQRAQKNFQQEFGSDCQAFFVFNGTAANVTALKAITKSYEAVFCSDTAHIQVDECGAPEAFIGCKLIPTLSLNGKLQIAELDKNYIRRGDQHFSQAAVLSITQPTELGTVYTMAELRALIEWAKARNLKVHLDGARLANAAAFLKVGFKEMTFDLGVDVVSFGGTKNGLMMGEAVIFPDSDAAAGFKFLRKQAGQLPSKTRFIACQFEAYFKNQLWKKIAEHSHDLAKYLFENCQNIPGVVTRTPPQSNAVFAVIPQAWVKPLRAKYFFYVWDEQTFECRWMISWDTTKEDINGFTKLLKELAHEIPSGSLP